MQLTKQHKRIIFLSLLVILTGIWDIYTTIPVLKYESSPFFLFINSSLTFLILTKIVGLGIIIFILFLYLNKKLDDKKYNKMKFLMIVVAIYLIFMQIYAGFNNIEVKQYVTEHPEVKIADKNTQINWYFKIINSLAIMPIILSLISFMFYEWIYVSQRL